MWAKIARLVWTCLHNVRQEVVFSRQPGPSQQPQHNRMRAKVQHVGHDAASDILLTAVMLYEHGGSDVTIRSAALLQVFDKAAHTHLFRARERPRCFAASREHLHLYNAQGLISCGKLDALLE